VTRQRTGLNSNFQNLNARKIPCRVDHAIERDLLRATSVAPILWTQTGRFRGSAHSNCNLNYKDSHCIPEVFHNLSGYDAHFIIKEIATAYEGLGELLPITKEKYISFTKNVQSTEDERKKNNIKLHSIDSYKFLTSSLDKLVYLSKNEL